MSGRSLALQAVRPLLRLGLVFGIVAFYHTISAAWFADTTRLAVVIALSFLTWILVAKFVFEPFIDTFDR